MDSIEQKAIIKDAENLARMSAFEKFKYMSTRGEASLRNFKDGTWSCKVNVFVDMQGIAVNAQSGYGHKTPEAAIDAAFDALTTMTGSEKFVEATGIREVEHDND